MKNRYFYIFAFMLALLLNGAPAVAADSVSAELRPMMPGETEELAVLISNSATYYGFQGDLTIPAGLEFATKDGKAEVRLGTRTDESFTTVTNLQGRTLRLAVFSTSHASISGNSGPLLYVKVRATENYAGGTMTLSNVVLTDGGDKDVNVPSFEVSVEPAVIPVTSISLSQTSGSLKVGESMKLTATVSPNNATDKTVTWSSSNPAVATVDNNGQVTAVALGEATVTASSGSVKATCKVTVVATPVTAISLSQTSGSLKVGETMRLTATVSPDNATDKTVTWSSSNPAVATISADGTVTAVALGETTVTASSGSAKATCKVTVVATPVTSITLSQTSGSLKVGESMKLTATVSPDNATDKTVSWSSSNPAVATVGADGTVTAVALGEATITASSGSVKATCKVTVVATPVTAISLSQTSGSLKVGESMKLTATVSPDNATDKTVTWSSSNPAVATVSADGTVTALALGEATVTASSGSVKATCKVTVVATPVTSITLSQTSGSLKVGESMKLSATVSPVNATDKSVTWSSSNPNVATVSADGTVTALALGEATVTASSGSVKATCKVTVVATPVTAISLSQTSGSLKVGESMKLTATVSPDNATDKTVTWSSSNPAVATVSADGTVTALALGEATVTASSGSVKATCKVTVVATPVTAITLSQTSGSLKVGESMKLTATVSPDNATDKTVTWASSNPAVATVSADGTVTALALGETTVTASAGNVKATCKVTVVATPVTAISLSQTSGSLKVGESMKLTATVSPDNATDKTVTWSTSNPAVATVGADGTVTALALGEATVTASAGNVKATCKVTVVETPVTAISLSQTSGSLKVGESMKLTATVSPNNATDKTVTWSSSNPAVATVGADGTVTAVALGEVTVTASSGSVKATCKVTVVETPVTAISLSQTSGSLKVGESMKLTATVSPDNATDKTVTWSSSNPAVATVSADGTVTAVALGETTVTASSGSVKATCKVTVVATPVTSITLSQTSGSLKVGESMKLTATVSPDNATDKTVTWSSSNPAVATVSADGTVTALALGETTVTASSGSIKATCKVTVVATPVTSISLSQTSGSLKVGESMKLTATVSPDNATDKSVTWSSSNPNVASVGTDGTVTASALGETTITASSGSVKATCKVTVVETPVTAISLSQTSGSLKVGESMKLTATVSPDNATDKTVTWSSSNPAVATVSADGTVTALALGEATVTASAGDVTATCTITVEPTLATSITLDITSKGAVVGEEFRLIATVLPEDATYKTVEWTSSDENVATVDDTGLVKVVGKGECVITATTTDGSDLSATCELTSTTGIADISGEEGSVDIYSLTGVLLHKDMEPENMKRLDPGIYIVRNGSETRKISVK